MKSQTVCDKCIQDFTLVFFHLRADFYHEMVNLNHTLVNLKAS